MNHKLDAEALQAVFEADDNIDRSDLLGWIAEGGIEEKGVIFEIVTQRHSRIQPRYDEEEWGAFIVDYCIACIMSDISEREYAHSNYEAAEELVYFLHRFVQAGERGETLVKYLVTQIEDAYRRGDDEIRLCIECGFLEHALECEPLRKIFAHWRHDPLFKEGYEESLIWGYTQGDPLKNDQT